MCVSIIKMSVVCISLILASMPVVTDKMLYKAYTEMLYKSILVHLDNPCATIEF